MAKAQKRGLVKFCYALIRQFVGSVVHVDAKDKRTP